VRWTNNTRKKDWTVKHNYIRLFFMPKCTKLAPIRPLVGDSPEELILWTFLAFSDGQRKDAVHPILYLILAFGLSYSSPCAEEVKGAPAAADHSVKCAEARHNQHSVTAAERAGCDAPNVGKVRIDRFSARQDARNPPQNCQVPSVSRYRRSHGRPSWSTVVASKAFKADAATSTTADRHLSIQTRRRWLPSICVGLWYSPPPKLAVASRRTVGRHFDDRLRHIIASCLCGPSVCPVLLIWFIAVMSIVFLGSNVRLRQNSFAVSTCVGRAATVDLVGGQESTC